jgi:drug/metabolite transporter (DMT)-like permease
MASTAILLTLAAAMSWAVTAVFMKMGVTSMTRIGFAAVRPWIGLVFVLPYALLVGTMEFGSPQLVIIALGGTLLNAVVGVSLFYYAITHAPLHQVSILSNTSPFWGVLSAVLILGEPANPVAFAAALLIVGGTYFLMERRKEGESGRHLLPLLAALASGVLGGFASAVPAKYCLENGMNPMGYHLLFTSGSAVMWSIIISPKLVLRRVKFTKRGMIIALVSAFFGYFCGWVLWLNALDRAPASLLAPIGGTSVLFTVLLSVVFLKERPTRRAIYGGVLVFAGVLLVSLAH